MKKVFSSPGNRTTGLLITGQRCYHYTNEILTHIGTTFTKDWCKTNGTHVFTYFFATTDHTTPIWVFLNSLGSDLSELVQQYMLSINFTEKSANIHDFNFLRFSNFERNKICLECTFQNSTIFILLSSFSVRILIDK